MRVPCVGAVVHDDEGRVLLVRRRNPPGAGRWSLPGGRVEPGESGTEATRREVREETGLDVEVGDLLGTVEIPAGDGRVFVVDDYACSVRGGGLAAGDDAVAARWVDSGELDRLVRAGALVEGLHAALAAWDVLPRPSWRPGEDRPRR